MRRLALLLALCWSVSASAVCIPGVGRWTLNASTVTFEVCASDGLTWAGVGAGGGAAWGTITGTLSSQTDLQTALDLKAPLASPTFTGTVTLPAGTVSLGMQANMATGSVVYRKTAGSGAPEVQTLATLKTDLGLTGTNSGDVTLGGSPDYITISGQSITRSLVNLTTHVTGVLPHGNLGTGGGGASKFLREDSTWQAIAGGGDVAGPASATDNAIARFDGTGGKTLQNSAATVSDDGVIRSAINSGANTVTVPLTNWLMLTADYTLSNSAAEQKAFNTTANGRLTLPTGVYEFECFLYLTTMSATSGNLAFDPVGAGTAVTDRWGQHAYGIDNNSPLAVGTRSGSASVTQQTPASAVTAGTGSGMVGTFSGMFRISTGGTIIPSVTLVTANAAVMKAGSWFKIKKIGESSETSVGAWD